MISLRIAASRSFCREHLRPFVMPSHSTGGETTSFPKLGGVFNWSSISSRPVPVRRPTALSPVSGYGDLYRKDTDGELHSPEIRLDGLVAKFVDGEWLTYGIVADGNAPQNLNGTSNGGNQRSEQNSSLREELDSVRSENNFLLTEVVAETHLREEEEKKRSPT